MLIKVTFPQQDVIVEEGTIIQWCKVEGDRVEEGEDLVEVETVKAVGVIPAPATGYLHTIRFREGDELPIGAVLAVIADSMDEKLPPDIWASPGIPVVPAERLPGRESVERIARPVEPRVAASPAARRLAKERALDLAEILRWSGRDVVEKEDVEAFLSQTVTEAAKVIPFSGIRKITAERMLESSRDIPHVTLHRKVDISKLVETRQEILKRADSPGGVKPSLFALLVPSIVSCLAKHPVLNARLTDRGIELQPGINLGLAVMSERGLLVPVLRQAEKKAPLELVEEAMALFRRAQEGMFSSDELMGGTFTVSNMGGERIEYFTPIINPPEVGILGVGEAAQEVRVQDGSLSTRWMLPLSLSFDHRVTDGVPAARFLQSLQEEFNKELCF